MIAYMNTPTEITFEKRYEELERRIEYKEALKTFETSLADLLALYSSVGINREEVADYLVDVVKHTCFHNQSRETFSRVEKRLNHNMDDCIEEWKMNQKTQTHVTKNEVPQKGDINNKEHWHMLWDKIMTFEEE